MVFANLFQVVTESPLSEYTEHHDDMVFWRLVATSLTKVCHGA